MNRRVVTCLMLAMGMTVIGCGDDAEEPVAPEPAAPQEQPAPPAGQTGAGAPSRELGSSPPPPAQTGQLEQPAPGAPEGASAEPTVRREERRLPPPPTQQPAGQQQRQPGTQAPGNDPQAQAQALIEQLTTQATNMQWAEAQQTLNQLKAMRGKVNSEMRVEIDNAETFLQSQKAINNVR